MRIERIDLKLVRLPLIRPFRTSSSSKDQIAHILVRVVADGVVGWGECASPSDPYYCPETVETCWHILKDFLGPLVLGRDWTTIDELTALYQRVKGNAFARAGLEMACWDALGRRDGQPLAALLGGVLRASQKTLPLTKGELEGVPGGPCLFDREPPSIPPPKGGKAEMPDALTEITSGVSLGIEPDRTILFDLIDQYLGEGYRRIKLKIAPGHDVEVVRAVRARYPALPLQVDANSAYTLDDIETLRRLDEFSLLLIEQPLAHDDIIDHARLQAALTTPICLDESIHSADDARHALDLGACRVINIKVSRLGGLREARRVHDLCLGRGVPVWCGGMHEFGIGRAANLALCSLPGFTLPGDISGSDKYYREDLIEPPLLATNGAVPVPRGPGLGVEPVEERIARQMVREWTLTE